MVDKSDLISGIQLAYDEILAFCEELSEGDRSISGSVDHWSARDILAHLGASNLEMAVTFATGLRGDQPPTGKSNIETFLQYKDKDWEVIFTLLQKAYTLLLDQVQALTVEELNSPFDWLNGRAAWRAIAASGFLHPVVHLAQVYIERGQGERAIRLNQRLTTLALKFDHSPDWLGIFLYNTGCFYALMGEKELALDNLEQGLSLSGRLIELSKHDTDLISLQGDADFLGMLERVSLHS